MKTSPYQFKYFRLPAIAFLLICSGYSAYAQSALLKNELLKITALSDSLTRTRAAESPYLQFDKPYYAVGDTLWFKAYLFNSAFLTGSVNSGIIYADIISDSDKVVMRYSFPLQAGLGRGNIGLDEKVFAPGTYTLRAYTTWMRNFDEDHFFYKTFYISSANETTWLISKQVSAGRSDTANVRLQFAAMDKTPAARRPLLLQLFDGNKRLYKQTMQTGDNGLLNLNFKAPARSSRLVIVAADAQENKKALIPVNLNRDANADVQFLPEGGSLVAGLPARIGFKATGEDGRGIAVSGIVYDNDNKQVAEFSALHNGMGSFILTVANGQHYTAQVTLPGGPVKTYPLPDIKNAGTVLQVKNLFEADSLEVFAAAAGIEPNDHYFLVGRARGIVCYAAVVSFQHDNYVKKKIAKSLFPTGIVHFTLMTGQRQPLNERQVFVNRHDELHITFTTAKPVYGARDSIALNLQVTDNMGKPVTGSFSLAVTDDAQVKTDTLNSGNILTRLLLTPDLKGYVEGPGYYLSAKTAEAWQALDNLMLTQGWVGYDWQLVFDPPALIYPPEREFTVKGSVINVFNRPVKKSDVLLLSKTPYILMDTLTDKNGQFIFNRFPEVDTPVFTIRALNKSGRSYNVGIKMDELTAPAYNKPAGAVITPWYVNSDTTLLNFNNDNALAKRQQNLPGGSHLLKEVKITAKKIIKDSQNLNGSGNADVVMDEKDLEKAGKKNWLQLLEENVPGFRIGMVSEVQHHSVRVDATSSMETDIINDTMFDAYCVKYKQAVFVVDGIKLDETVMPMPIEYQKILNYKIFLESHNAEDIKGIEVNFSPKYNARYSRRFENGMDPIDRFVYIEITTRSGAGPFINNTPGVYLYKPLALSWPKQFYKPKYTLADTMNRVPDMRSTIDWEPNITTGINGKARISFYSADKPSTYTITIEGSDMNGHLGMLRGTILFGKNRSGR